VQTGIGQGIIAVTLMVQQWRFQHCKDLLFRTCVEHRSQPRKQLLRLMQSGGHIGNPLH
jgi:hypothetical protein